MILSTILTCSLLVAPQEFTVAQARLTPSTIAQFGGVELIINQNAFEEVPLGATIVIRDFPLGIDREVDLRVERIDAFTDLAQVVVSRVDAKGHIINEPIERPDVVLLRGSIDRDPSATVFLAFGQYTTNGIIESQGSTYILSQHPDENLTVIYNMTDVDPELMNWAPFQCEVEEMTDQIKKRPVGTNRNSGGDCTAIQLAVDTDWEFTGGLFGGNVLASSEYAATLIAAVSGVYFRDVDVWTHISYLRLWDTPADPWNANDTAIQLPQFKEHWQSEMQTVPRHLAHLLSGRNLGGGRGYLASVCTPFGYSVSGNLNGYFPLPLEDHTPISWDFVVVAHEQGHNCGTWHTHNYSPPLDGCGLGDCADAFGGTIMSYCHTCSGGMTNIALEFHPEVQETMEDFLDNLSCSLDCDQFINGACCDGDECIELPVEDCENTNGVFLGTGTLCATGGCEPQDPGACCIGGDGTCAELDADTCLTAGGIFLGLNSTCDSGWCDPDAPFACCFGLEECQVLSLADCNTAGGQFEWIGSTCENGCQPLHNDFCESAILVSTGVHEFSTYDAISDNVPYNSDECSSEYLGGVFADVWFKYEACESSDLLISTCGLINFDSDIVVYKGECDTLYQVECNGDGIGCAGFSSELTFEVTEGTTYYIRIGGFNDESYGKGQLVLGDQQCQPDVPCTGDVNNDDYINVTDILILIDNWGLVDPQYDIDEDGIVGLGDILYILSAWGFCET